jgi:alpha-L-rhamnosidase
MKYFNLSLTNRSLIVFSLLIPLLIGCNRSENKSITGESVDLQHASWIGDARTRPATDSLMYGEFPAPLFRKEFSAGNDIKTATLFITAAGYYHATINGERIGENYLDPAWTNFSKRIYYTQYDITSQIKQGINCLGVTLGNGFYNLLPMRMWGGRNLREVLPSGNPVFIARLRLEYTDGKIDEVITDKSWKYSYGPIIKNNVYLGEVYDAGKEIKDWNVAGFVTKNWMKAVKTKKPGVRLQKAFFPPIKISDVIRPVAVTSPEDGIYIVDMGVNFTGLYRIRLQGEPGDTIVFRFGERLYENGNLNPMTAVAGQIKRKGMGGLGSPAVAWQTDSYIFGNQSDIGYSPLFTFHVYRYMEISGLKYEPSLDDMEGIAFNTRVENNNYFNCSSELLNSIQRATLRTFKNNLISVQSDCPGREKFGYGGDLNATAESFIYNFDMHSFYRKTIYDWVDAMSDSIFIDTAPYVGIKYCGISWESAFLITQYLLYLYYNDIELVKELYDLNLQWMQKVARFHPDGIVGKGLADHESLQPVPVELIGTTHYLYCARIMNRFATLMNDGENEEKFELLSKKLQDLVLDNFWRKPFIDTINKQTLFSTLLYYDIIPADEQKACIDSLFKVLDRSPAGHFTTGIFGTKYILEALSAAGNGKSVYDIVNSKAFPGWGFMIDHGATTIWETWKESDNVYSNCHPMFGSVSEWFYRWLAGVRPDPDNPGFRKFTIAPVLPKGLDYVKCNYNSPFGEIISNWEQKGSNNVVFDIKIPAGTIATVKLPVTRQQKFTILNRITKSLFVPDENRERYEEFELKPGEYTITAY